MDYMNMEFLLPSGESYQDIVPCQRVREFTTHFVQIMKQFDQIWLNVKLLNNARSLAMAKRIADHSGDNVPPGLGNERVRLHDNPARCNDRAGNLTADLFKLVSRLGYLQSRLRAAAKNEVDQKLYDLLGDMLTFYGFGGDGATDDEYTDIDAEIDKNISGGDVVNVDGHTKEHRKRGGAKRLTVSYLMETYGVLLIELNIHTEVINFLQLYNGDFYVTNGDDPTTDLHKKIHFVPSTERRSMLEGRFLEPYIAKLRIVTIKRKMLRRAPDAWAKIGGNKRINDSIDSCGSQPSERDLRERLQRITNCMETNRVKIYSASNRLNDLYNRKFCPSGLSNDGALVHRLRETLIHMVLHPAFIMNAKLIHLAPDNNTNTNDLNHYGDFRLS